MELRKISIDEQLFEEFLKQAFLAGKDSVYYNYTERSGDVSDFDSFKLSKIDKAINISIKLYTNDEMMEYGLFAAQYLLIEDIYCKCIERYTSQQLFDKWITSKVILNNDDTKTNNT